MKWGRPALTAVAIAVLTGCSTAPESPAEGDPSRYEGKSFGAAMAECLTGKGWPATPNGDDGLSVEVTEPQQSAFDSAQVECHTETGYNAEVEELTTDEVAAWFDQLVESSACLADLGYDAPEPPSRQSFIDAYFADPSGLWNPYPAPDSLDEWASIEQACPQPGTGETAQHQSFD